MEDNTIIEEQPIAEAPKSGREKRKEKRQAKKAARKAKYNAMSKNKKILYWVIRGVIAAALLAALIVGISVAALVYTVKSEVAAYVNNERSTTPLSWEELYEISPADEAGTARVNALPKYNKDDTWAVYIYLCGSDLESQGINRLSPAAEFLSSVEANAIREQNYAAKEERILTFISEINAEGMDLPDHMYMPTEHLPSEEDPAPREEQLGCASADLREMFDAELPENVKVIIQTGGAKRWTQSEVNPNRSQRFIYDSKGFRLLEENPLMNMGAQETLEDFLRFCNDKYSADHKMLLFWNHGGGVGGFCVDEIFGGDRLTFREFNGALQNVHKADIANPPYELMGFDACLMASSEIAHYIKGYGKYLVASEEIEPGRGWYHTDWLNALGEDPGMNGAQLGMAVADSYISSYANDSVFFTHLDLDCDVTMSVVDVEKTAAAYDAYAELIAAALKDSVNKPGAMATLGAAASSSVRYAQNAYDIYNTVDLKRFMEGLTESYPAEANKVIGAVEEAVLYSRAASYLKDSTGLSVYFPIEINNMSALNFLLQFMNEVCANEEVKALYYYKAAGCLNPELQSYVLSKGYGAAKPLDTAALKQLAKAAVVPDNDGNFSLSPLNEALSMTQDYRYELAHYDEESGTIVYYGFDTFVELESESRLRTVFDGTWLSLGAEPLALDMIGGSASTVTYRSPVCVNGKDCYLILIEDRATGEIVISGVSDMANADTAGRSKTTLEDGATIKPIYETNSIADKYSAGTVFMEYGKPFTYHAVDKPVRKALENGSYFAFITLRDTRSDEYYSPIVQLSVQGGKITKAEVRADLYNVRD